MLGRITCSDCTASARVDTDRAIRTLRSQHRYGFGDHVSDPRAFAIRLMRLAAWCAVSRLGKSTVTMRCRAHRDHVSTDADPL